MMRGGYQKKSWKRDLGGRYSTKAQKTEREGEVGSSWERKMMQYEWLLELIES